MWKRGREAWKLRNVLVAERRDDSAVAVVKKAPAASAGRRSRGVCEDGECHAVPSSRNSVFVRNMNVRSPNRFGLQARPPRQYHGRRNSVVGFI